MDHQRNHWIGRRRGDAGRGRRALLTAGAAVGAVWAGAAFLAPRPATDSAEALSDAARAVVAEAEALVVAAAWDLPNLEHERVDFWVTRFTTDPTMREKMEGFLHRAGIYEPTLRQKLTERGMPQDLIYLAMIESGFQANAYSTARASGLWQFIAETGQRYGLAIDRAVDERNDPIKATDAALDYLEELHGRFGSWYLAAAAYNTGENRVGRIMREEFGTERARSEADYYRIWDRLPRETRDYVPLMIAAARISKDLPRYGFDHVVPAPPLRYQEVVVPPATELDRIAEAAGITVAELKELNPHFRIHRTPDNREYPVRLPEGSLDRFATGWAGDVRLARSATVE